MLIINNNNKKNHKSFLISSVLTLFLSLSFACEAQTKSELNTAFKASYHAYQASLKENDTAAQLKFSEKSYELGKKLYGDSDINTGNLAFILGKLYIKNKAPNKATPLLSEALSIFKESYDPNAIEIAEVYIALADAVPYNKNKTAFNYYESALDISQHYEDISPLTAAAIQFEVGIGYLNKGSKKSVVLLDVRDVYASHFPANDRRVVESNFYVGKYYLVRQKYRTAIKYLKMNIPVFEALEGATHPYELSSRAFLINALENAHRSDEATKHCIAIGKMTPRTDNQDVSPLFRVEPRYPISSARQGKSGWVKMGFVISDSGMVTNATIIDSEGGKKFEKSALAALRNWRYAPKFDDGKAINSDASVRMDFKMGN